MNLVRPPSRSIRRISLIPLIDIVFILLLFFILETNFLRLGELALNLPQREQGAESTAQVLHLQVFDNGRIWLSGRSLSLDTLDSYLTAANHGAQTPILVSAEDNLSVQILVRVVDMLQRHELSHIQISALEE